MSVIFNRIYIILNLKLETHIVDIKSLEESNKFESNLQRDRYKIVVKNEKCKHIPKEIGCFRT